MEFLGLIVLLIVGYLWVRSRGSRHPSGPGVSNADTRATTAPRPSELSDRAEQRRTEQDPALGSIAQNVTARTSGDRELFSHSRLELFEKCPRAYQFRYLERLPEAFGTIETFLGRCVHSALEWAYGERDSRGAQPSRRAVIDRFHAHWSAGTAREMHLVKRGKRVESYRDAGRAMLASYWDRNFSRDDMETVALEHSFVLPLLNGAGYRGIVDRIARDRDGHLHLIDFKTGNSQYIRPPQRSRQLPSYALWALEAHAVREAELVVEDLQGERSLRHRIHTSDLGPVAAALEADIHRVRAAQLFPTEPSVLCGWCGFRPHCPEGQRRWEG